MCIVCARKRGCFPIVQAMAMIQRGALVLFSLAFIVCRSETAHLHEPRARVLSTMQVTKWRSKGLEKPVVLPLRKNHRAALF